jgi:hypothetical protein
MESISVIREIRRIYDEYLAETVRLETVRKPTDGLLGFGRGPDSDLCHDRFSERLEQALGDIAATSPASQDVYEVLRYMYDTPLQHKDNMLAYWMMLAVQSLTENLIGFLSPEDAASLSARYREAYPKSVRLPAQKKIALRLLSQSGDMAVRKRNSLLDIFRRRRHSR